MLHALVVALVLLGSTAACAQTAPLSTRPQLDSELARATDVGQLLQIANRYVDAGYQQEAKAIVDRAAQKARSSGDWQSIAALYLRLGFADDANSAQRRARNVSR
jgi:Tfp pilus assembly protein PilF